MLESFFSGFFVPNQAFFENLNSDLNYAFDVKRGYGIDGKSDGLIYKNLQANYSHLRDVNDNHWAQRFTDFIRKVINTY